MKYTPKQYWTAYKKGLGLSPTNYIWVPFGGLLEIDRCHSDGGLVTNSQSSIAGHVGHQLVAPTRVSFFELLLIWLRIIR